MDNGKWVSHSSKALYICSRSPGLRFHLGHQVSWPVFSVVFLGLSKQMPDSTLIWPQPLPNHSQFICDFVIWCYICHTDNEWICFYVETKLHIQMHESHAAVSGVSEPNELCWQFPFWARNLPVCAPQHPTKLSNWRYGSDLSWRCSVIAFHAVLFCFEVKMV
jgi:hypothetical protein